MKKMAWKCQPKRGHSIERPFDERQLESVTDGNRHGGGGACGMGQMPGHAEGEDVVPASTQRRLSQSVPLARSRMPRVPGASSGSASAHVGRHAVR